jgi:Rieske Fe-S protein
MPERRRETKSPYTADRGIPGAFEGETITRRRLMTGGAHTFGAIAAAAFTLPALGFALGPVFEREEARWEKVGEVGKTTVYIRKHDEAIDGPMRDGYDAFIALSTRCMHLGCPIRYVDASQRFICPCHGGVYDFQGKVSGGPPVRPLDRFYTRIRGGSVEIGPRYSVNSQLERFSPRDPGEPLDGIGQYLYPRRLSTPELDKSTRK